MGRDRGAWTVGLAVWTLLMSACADVHGARGADDTPLPPARTAVEPNAEPEPGPDPDGDRTKAPPPTAPRATPAGGAALFLLQNAAESELVVMRNGERIAELPAFASWQGYERAGMTTLVAVPKYAVISHTATRDYDSRGIVADPDRAMQPPTSTVQRLMLVRRSDWRVLWQRTSEWLSNAAHPLLGTDGRVALHEQPFEGRVDRMVVIEPNGETSAIPATRPLAAPDADGWIAVSTPGYVGTLYGFARAGELVRLLSERLQNDGADDPYFVPHPRARPDGTFDYISEDASSGELALVHEGPSSLARIPLGRSPTGRASFVRGEHAWLLLSLDEGTGNPTPWLRVDRDGVVHGLGAELESKDFSGCCGAADDWMAFREHNRFATAGWLNADSGEVKRAPAPPSGMRPFGIDHCMSSPQLGEDGRVIMGLRDDVIGGVFIEDGEGGFKRVGLPMRDSLYVEISRVGATLQLSAIDPHYRYCPQAIWTTPEPEGPLLRGGQTELLRAGRSLVIDDRSGFGAELDPSGRYAPVSSDAGRVLVLHDLETGTVHELPESTRLVGWLGSDREPGLD